MSQDKQKMVSKLSKTEKELSEYINQKQIGQRINFNSLPGLPEMKERHEFIGKWFRGGNGPSIEDDGIDGDVEDDIDYDLKKLNDDDLEGQTSDFEEWWGVER